MFTNKLFKKNTNQKTKKLKDKECKFYFYKILKNML